MATDLLRGGAGLRLSELAARDVADLDTDLSTVRVLGKGRAFAPAYAPTMEGLQDQSAESEEACVCLPRGF
jgi:hypothetical protein